MIQGLDCYDYKGEGYQPQMVCDGWRVAYLNAAPRFTPEGMTRLERHMETDEVFVLLSGEATLYIGRPAEQVKMVQGAFYNVRRATWHGIIVSPDARVLIVENDSTSRDNSEYCEL